MSPPHGEASALLGRAVSYSDPARKGTTEFGTWFNILCTMAGTGILALPATLNQGGWLVMALILVVAVTTNYTGKAIISCLYLAGGGDAEEGAAPTLRRLASYPDVGYAAYGRAGRWVVQAFHKATLLGVSTLFIIVTAKFLLEGIGGGGEGLAPGLGSPAEAATWQKRWGIAAGCALLIPLVCVKTLREMPALAAFGMMTTLLTILAVVVLAVAVSPLTNEKVRDWDLPSFNGTEGAAPVDVTHKLFDVGMFPTAFATITLSFGGHAVFPTIEEHMAAPLRFPAVLNKAYVLLTAMYFTCAIAGYAAFGDHVDNPVLCNMPRAGHLAIFGQVTKLAIVVHVMSAYCMLMNTALTEFERGLGLDGDGWRTIAVRSAFRAAAVAVTVAVAIFVPYFAEVMSFLGSACLTTIVFICPVVFSYKLRRGISGPEKAFMLFVLLLGVSGGTIGCYQSVKAIVQKLQAGDTQ